MEFIDLDKAEKEIISLGAGETATSLILNNIRQYNSYITAYKDDVKKMPYVAYQLNVQITKQLSELRKFNPKAAEEEDEFSKLIKGLKPPKKDPPPAPEEEKPKPPKKRK